MAGWLLRKLDAVDNIEDGGLSWFEFDAGCFDF